MLSGVLASLLIPALTRVWQDRPRELALKRSLVQQISKSATEALQDGESTGLSTKSTPAHPEKADVGFIRLRRRWEVKSARVNAELTTYFRKQRVLARWHAFSDAMINYLDAAAHDNFDPNDRNGGYFKLLGHFKHQKYADSRAAQLRDRLREHPSGLRGADDCRPRFCAARLLAAERDQLPRIIVDAHAAGFSRGWWIFK